LPGCLRAISISSRSVFAPTPGLTATTSGEELTLVIGARSRLGSKPAFGLMMGFTRMLDGLAMRIV
jgi:hypothetical protein